MQILQNKIIITLLIVIALGISYFVTQDVLEKKAKRDALEKARIERENDRIERDKRIEKSRKSRKEYLNSIENKKKENQKKYGSPSVKFGNY